MKKRLRRVQASILLVLLTFLSFNASKVTTVTEKENVEQCDNLTAGVVDVVNQLLEQAGIEDQEYRIRAGVTVAVPIPTISETEADIVAPERDIVQSAECYALIEETETVETNDVEQEEVYYSMSQEEFETSCKIAVAEAGNQGLMGMVYVINCSINNAKALGITLLEEYNGRRYSSIVNGEVCIVYYNSIGEQVIRPITDDMITDEVRQAVSMAASKDYTEEMLKDVAIAKGYDSSYYEGGARYFYNPNGVSAEQLAKRANISVSFTHNNHVFYRVWD